MPNNLPQFECSKNTTPNTISQLMSVLKHHRDRKLQVPIWGRDGPTAGTRCPVPELGQCQNGVQHIQMKGKFLLVRYLCNVALFHNWIQFFTHENLKIKTVKYMGYSGLSHDKHLKYIKFQCSNGKVT